MKRWRSWRNRGRQRVDQSDHSAIAPSAASPVQPRKKPKPPENRARRRSLAVPIKLGCAFVMMPEPDPSEDE